MQPCVQNGTDSIFINPENLPQNGYGFFQCILLFIAYAYILSIGSNMISDGSELLLLIPSLAGIVGSVVLPVLGAVPDGAIVLFSGFGKDPQLQLDVGIGALAGSTIMLLTIPWGLAILGGRVQLLNGLPLYKKPANYAIEFEKLPQNRAWGLFSCGVAVDDVVRKGGNLMMLTAMGFWVIQGPALSYQRAQYANIDHEMIRIWSIIGFLYCLLGFCGYLYYMYLDAQQDEVHEEKMEQIQLQFILNKNAKLISVVAPIIESMMKNKTEDSGLLSNTSGLTEAEVIIKIQGNEKLRSKVQKLVKPYFAAYDTDKSGSIEIDELQCIMAELGEPLSGSELKKLLANFDKDNNGTLDLVEFSDLLIDIATKYVLAKQDTTGDPNQEHIKSAKRMSTMPVNIAGVVNNSDLENNVGLNDEDDEEEEDEEIPEDLQHLDYQDQQKAIFRRACVGMGLGTILVLVFSDPMVDILNNFSTRTGIPAFYISFVLAPLVSNASELIAAYNYAKKKTSKSIAISLSTLTGAACMNNTFCLMIFFLLIFSLKLNWDFTAETLVIFFAQLVMYFYCYKRVHTLFDCACIFALYPLSILFVWILESVAHLQ